MAASNKVKPIISAIVGSILLLACGLAIPLAFVYLCTPRIDFPMNRARMDIKTLEQAVSNYYVRHGMYPDSLTILTEPGSFDKGTPALENKRVLIDPWGNPYVYEPKNQQVKTGKPLIYSNGPPGEKNRISNWY